MCVSYLCSAVAPLEPFALPAHIVVGGKPPPPTSTLLSPASRRGFLFVPHHRDERACYDRLICEANGLDFARVESNVVRNAALEGTALAC
jgi:hypothetical protein